jgi:8-hydroxy-5-deazaflavin:NADPH oxidoreductase
MSQRKIGILGTGRMGRALGSAWARAGHAVFFGSRDPAKAADAAQGVGAAHGDFAAAARFGEVVLLTVRPPFPAALVEPRTLEGRVVIDCNNSAVYGLDAVDPEGRPGIHFASIVPSLAERLAAELCGARLVKAFNTIPSVLLDLPDAELRAAQIAVFIAGDDAEARRVAAELAIAIGFAAVDCGTLEQARLLESLADVVRHQIIVQKGSPYASVTYRIARAS